MGLHAKAVVSAPIAVAPLAGGARKPVIGKAALRPINAIYPAGEAQPAPWLKVIE
jgi:hypothetical protein